MSDDKGQLPLIPSESVAETKRAMADDARVVDTYTAREGSMSAKATVGKMRRGKPKRVIKTAMRMKLGYGGGGGGGGGIGGGIGGTIEGSGGNFYSPELSTDFLEKPQSIDEERNYYRYFAENEPFVAQALDLHTELPLSKIRLAMPKSDNKELAKKAYEFCEWWAEELNLQQHLLWITWHFHAIGECHIFMEDTNEKAPREVREEVTRFFDDETGEAIEDWQRREDADDREFQWLMKNYKGFTAIRIIPPEQVHMESFPLTDEKIFDFIPDDQLRSLVAKSQEGDERAKRIVESYPPAIVDRIRQGEGIPLDTDWKTGSFLYYMARKRYPYAPRGQSMLKRCLNELVYFDKLRQAQTSIASRHMTPMRIVWAKDMDEQDIDLLREQVDLALADPDFSIITNFEINWEEMGPNDRLLDLQGEYDLWSRKMYAGLGVTESLLSGETSYSGERISLEVINVRYMHLRMMLKDFVEKFLFRPMCWRLGFIEEDSFGRERVIYPRLSFTRLGIRDDPDTRDFLYNLYLKNSCDIDTILESVNLDPDEVHERLERDKFTIKDALFNEGARSLYSTAGNMIAEHSEEAVKYIAKQMGFGDYQKPKEGGGRFASTQTPGGAAVPGSVEDLVGQLVVALKEQARAELASEQTQAESPTPES